jgi:hypothetical protein
LLDQHQIRTGVMKRADKNSGGPALLVDPHGANVKHDDGDARVCRGVGRTAGRARQKQEWQRRVQVGMSSCFDDEEASGPDGRPGEGA